MLTCPVAKPSFECKLFDFSSNILFLILFIYLFLAVLGLHCCVGFFLLVAASGGYSQVAGCRLLFAMASLVAEHRL